VDGAESGSLSHLVSFDVGRSFAERRDKNFDVLLLLLTTPISAVLFYVFYRRDTLIVPMISGVRLDHLDAAPAIEIPSWRRTVVGVALAAVATWSVAAGVWS
jgi:hypothetical protein